MAARVRWTTPPTARDRESSAVSRPPCAAMFAGQSLRPQNAVASLFGGWTTLLPPIAIGTTYLWPALPSDQGTRASGWTSPFPCWKNISQPESPSLGERMKTRPSMKAFFASSQKPIQSRTFCRLYSRKNKQTSEPTREQVGNGLGRSNGGRGYSHAM